MVPKSGKYPTFLQIIFFQNVKQHVGRAKNLHSLSVTWKLIKPPRYAHKSLNEDRSYTSLQQTYKILFVSPMSSKYCVFFP
jgi:hypothetical protein